MAQINVKFDSEIDLYCIEIIDCRWEEVEGVGDRIVVDYLTQDEVLSVIQTIVEQNDCININFDDEYSVLCDPVSGCYAVIANYNCCILQRNICKDAAVELLENLVRE